MASVDEILKNLGSAPITKGPVSDVVDNLLLKDLSVDTTGIPLFKFRAALSRMDTPEERRNFLSQSVGKEGFTTDKFGRLAITPSGQTRLGLKSKAKPVLIDEPGLSTGDIADLASVGPPVLGATAAGVAAGTGGLGTLPAMGMVALGGMGGKAIDELVESFQGLQRQSPGQISSDIALEGGLSLLGEGVTRGILQPIGRRILQPAGPRGAERAARAEPIVQDLRRMGAQPSIAQVTEAPLLGRQTQLANFIFGDPRAVSNSRAFARGMVRLRRGAGPKTTGVDLGGTISNDISSARSQLSEWAKVVYGNIESLSNKSDQLVPTRILKSQAQDILDSLGVQTSKGERIFADPQLASNLKKTLELPDQVTISEMQQTSNILFEAIADESITPGISGRNARLLFKATRRSLLDIQDPQIRNALQTANKEYGRRIRQFNDSFVRRIMKDPGKAGRIEPELIVSSVFQKGRSSQLKRLMRVLPEDTKAKIRRSAMDDLLDKLVKETDDPLRKVFDGKSFIVNLNSFGKETLEAMFGRDLTKDAFRFGRAVQLATKKFGQSGKLAAAGLALRPLDNLPRLLKLRIVSGFLNTPKGFNLFTKGILVPRVSQTADIFGRIATQLLTRAAAMGPQEVKEQLSSRLSGPDEVGEQ